MNARAHFLLRAAAIAVLVVEAVYPRPTRATLATPVAITALAPAPTLSAPPAIVATR